MVTRINGYHISEVIYESPKSRIYRGHQRQTGQAVVLKVLKDPYPSPELIARFRREYELTRNLELDGVIKVYDFIQAENSPAMILEDFGGISLGEYVSELRLSLPEFLSLAIRITEIIGQLHQQNIVHKDINPANILYNPTTGQVKLIDFGISTQLSLETPALRNPKILEGTLAYMSPEQTGRMNRPLDYRTDFYSLGITFYELLTGTRPFVSDDPMSLVHSHIAVEPTPPHRIDPAIPRPLSAIILKLLAKTAEERYQSAHGLAADLEICLRQWETTGQITTFPLGQHDYSDRFRIPQKLYGRQAELGTLLDTFERACHGNNEFLLVKGLAGIGKSALINEIHKPIVQRRGYFAAGKFDPLQRNVPYSAIVSAFRELIRQLLAESENQLAHWREALTAAMAPNAQLIVNGIPELALIIGPQPPVPDLGPTESQNRFNLVMQNFITTLAQPNHPLILVLDDLQWADSASLAIVVQLVTNADLKHFCLIGAYRDNEIDDGHPLQLALQKITQSGLSLTEISLTPLDLRHVNHLLTETLQASAEQTLPLAKLILGKTNGNPFFVNEFLKTLYRDGHLTFDFEREAWQWALPQIAALDITDNVVDLMSQQLQKLPPPTQKIVQLAGAIGSHFTLHTLAVIDEATVEATADALWPALTTGLIVPLDETYHLVHGYQPQPEDTATTATIAARLDLAREAHYKFLHDRVQQAAYASIPETKRAEVHYRIGRQMLQEWEAGDSDDVPIFELVNQLNLGSELIVSAASRRKLANLNLIAGRQAKTGSAYGPALTYLQVGLALLAADSWQTDYDLTLALHIEAGETAYLTTDFAIAEALVQKSLAQVTSLLDRIRIYEIRMQSYFSQLKIAEMIQTAVTALDLLGHPMPHKPAQWRTIIGLLRTRFSLDRRSLADLRQLPRMTDPSRLAAMRILTKLGVATYFVEPDLVPFTIFKMIELSLKYGNAPSSGYAYGTYGLILTGALGNIEAGYRYGQYALDLLETLAAEEVKCKTHVLFYGFIKHWKEPLAETLAPLLEGYQAGLATGDLEFAAAATVVYCYHALFCGRELAWVAEETARYTSVTRKIKQERYLDSNLQNWQAALNLMGQTDDPCRLVGEQYNEDQALTQLAAANDRNAICSVYFYKTFLNVIFNNYEQALYYAQQVEDDLDTLMASAFVPAHNFCYSLALLGCIDRTSSGRRRRYLRQLRKNRRQLRKWADHSPPNHAHKYQLIAAELARLEDRPLEAMSHFDQAIDGAQRNGFLHEEAMACELAAHFYFGRNQPKIARLYLIDAHYAYLRWGAQAKVDQLEEIYPFLQQAASRPRSPGDTITLGTAWLSATTTAQTAHHPPGTLDLDTVMKASQAISEEIVFSKLLEKLLIILLENAGAEKGIFILEQRGERSIEAVGMVRNQRPRDANSPEYEVRILRATPLADYSDLPRTIINYVGRTHEYVVLDDAAAAGPFTTDSYIMARQPKSVLCLPLLNQGQLIGLLYLENNLLSGAFTADRLEVLNLLSTQAAISIENAALYAHLEDLVEERTAELQQANTQLRALNNRLQNELVMAQKIQRSLLPPPHPQWTDPLLYSYTTPAREVGGDFYAYQAFDDGRYAVAVGDVSDKGMPAALLMAVSIASLQAVIDQSLPPAQLLAQLDDALLPYTRTTRQNCALCYVLLDGQTLTLANAGCISPLVRRSDGSVVWLETGGLPLGIGLGAQLGYQELNVTLNNGDLVVLTSDGVVEATNTQEELFGFTRLEQAISGSPHHPQRLLNHLRQTVATFVGQAEPHDDATIVVFQIGEP